MLRFAQFGAGRIGAIHAANLAATKDTQLLHIVDVNADAARVLAARHGAKVSTVSEVLADPQVDAVIIASSTDTHADLVIAAAKAGKAIFCEKPIDLSLKRVDACLAAVKKAKVPKCRRCALRRGRRCVIRRWWALPAPVAQARVR